MFSSKPKKVNGLGGSKQRAQSLACDMFADQAFQEHKDRKLGSIDHPKQAMRSVKLGNIPEEAKYADEDQVDLIRFNQFLEYYDSQEKN